jgi:uncharacterized surface protein with fasciclin (FAS1) repeats
MNDQTNDMSNGNGSGSQPPKKRQRIGLIAVLVLALGPLAALTFGSKYAPEETRERADAALENAEPKDRYGAYEAFSQSGDPEDTVVDVTEGSGLFASYNRALSGAGMAEVLRERGPFTVFAPTEEAFSRMPEQQRSELLKDQQSMTDFVSGHVVRGRLSATDLLQKAEVETLDGKTVPVMSEGHLSFGDAEIIKSNLLADNGIVHVIDNVVTRR